MSANDEAEDRFPARRILDENSSKQLYKVDWEGVDPETGRAWSPTWEPYEYVSSLLVDEWLAKAHKQADASYRKASRAALRDYDIRRNRSESPNGHEHYVSPSERDPETWSSHSLSPQKKQSEKKQAKRKSAPGERHKPSKRRKRESERGDLPRPASKSVVRELYSDSPSPQKHVEPSRAKPSQDPAVKKSEKRRARQTSASEEEPVISSKRTKLVTLSDFSEDSSDESEGVVVDTRPTTSNIHLGDTGRTGTAYSSKVALSAAHETSLPPSPPPPEPPKRPKLTALPESLRPRTASESVFTTTAGTFLSSLGNIFTSSTSTSDLSHLPPSARPAEKAKRDKIDLAGSKRPEMSIRGRYRSSGPRERSEDEERAKHAESSLPSFRRGGAASVPITKTDLGLQQRAPLKPTQHPDWALLQSHDTAQSGSSKSAGNTSTSVIPDSQSQGNRTLASDTSTRKKDNTSSTRQSLSPGSRSAQAKTEKPRKPIRVPDPSVFVPLLSGTQLTEDIGQFSSQLSPPEVSSSEEIRRQLTPAADLIEDEDEFQASQEIIEVDDNDEQVGVTFGPFEAADAPSDVASSSMEQTFKTASQDGVSASVPENVEVFRLRNTNLEAAGLGAAMPQAAEIPIPLAVEPISTEKALQPEASTSKAPGQLGVHNVAADEAIPSALAGSAEPMQAASAAPAKKRLGKPTVVETSTSERIAVTKTRQSILVTSEDTRQEIMVFLEAPEYYGHKEGAALNKKAEWDIELEKETDEAGEVSWHLVLDMSGPSWRLEKRLRSFIAVDDSNASELYDNLLEEHELLRQAGNAHSILLGQLERDLVAVRESDRVKARRIEGLELDKLHLQKQVGILENQLRLGIAQVEAVYAAKENRMEEERDKALKKAEFAQQALANADLATLAAKAARWDEAVEREARAKEQAAADAAKARAQAAAYTAFLRTMAQMPGGASAAQASGIAVQADASSEDEDFVEESENGSGTDSGNSDMSTDSGSSSPAVAVPAVEPASALASTIHDIPTILEGQELGVIPGGLASISPAPVEMQPKQAAVQVVDSSQNVDTSGDTTEATTTTTSAAGPLKRLGTQSQSQSQSQSFSSGAPKLIESEDILELDSSLLESQLGFACEWGKASGAECRKLFASQVDLHQHIGSAHFP